MARKTENYLFKLAWAVDPAGYVIDEAGAIKPKHGKRWKKYDPFQRPGMGLARTFSRIPVRGGSLDRKRVFAFANDYGLLGINQSYGVEKEDLEAWRDAVLSLRSIFDAIDKGKSEDALYYFNGSGKAPLMRLNIPIEKEIRKRSLELTPETLYGAMWLMAANELSLGTQHQKCKAPGCAEYFPRRRNKKFCSDSCKMAAHRAKAR